MGDKQGVIIFAVIFVSVLLVVAAAILTQMDLGQNRNNIKSEKRFQAKAGTTRDNATLLSTSKRGSTQGEASDTAPPQTNSEKPPIPVRSLNPVEDRLDGPVSDTDRLVHGALNAFSAETGIAKLQAALADPLLPEDAARVHAALGQLYMQQAPPNYAAAQAAFDHALSRAASPGLRATILVQYGMIALSQGDPAVLRAKIEAEMKQPAATSPERLRLQTMLARSQEAMGDAAAAERTYLSVIEQTAVLEGGAPGEADDLRRLTGLRLSRLYRNDGRASEADSLAEEMAKPAQ